MKIRKFQFGLHFEITPIKYKNLSLLPLFWFFEFNRHENHPHLHLHFYPSTSGNVLVDKVVFQLSRLLVLMNHEMICKPGWIKIVTFRLLRKIVDVDITNITQSIIWIFLFSLCTCCWKIIFLFVKSWKEHFRFYFRSL